MGKVPGGCWRPHSGLTRGQWQELCSGVCNFQLPHQGPVLDPEAVLGPLWSWQTSFPAGLASSPVQLLLCRLERFPQAQLKAIETRVFMSLHPREQELIRGRTTKLCGAPRQTQPLLVTGRAGWWGHGCAHSTLTRDMLVGKEKRSMSGSGYTNSNLSQTVPEG